MTNEEVLEARNHYCFSRACRNCLFQTYSISKFNKKCWDLTPYQICDILSIIEEEESMTKKEEIQQEIEKTQKQLAALQEKLKEAEEEVPEELIIGTGDEYYYVSYAGDIHYTDYTPVSSSDVGCVRNRRAFLTKEYAEVFAEKTQFIADMLHFKYLYDRDYKPDWNDEPAKYFIQFDHSINLFTYDSNVLCEKYSEVYFSSKKIAQKCIDWLNKKYGYTKE